MLDALKLEITFEDQTLNSKDGTYNITLETRQKWQIILKQIEKICSEEKLLAGHTSKEVYENHYNLTLENGISFNTSLRLCRRLEYYCLVTKFTYDAKLRNSLPTVSFTITEFPPKKQEIS